MAVGGPSLKADTVSCTQAEALVLAAETRLKRRPRRRTELLRQRIQACEQQVAQIGERWETQQQAVKRAKERLAEAEQQVQERKLQVAELEKHYQTRKLQERPTSHLAQARPSPASSRETLKQSNVCLQASPTPMGQDHGEAGPTAKRADSPGPTSDAL